MTLKLEFEPWKMRGILTSTLERFGLEGPAMRQMFNILWTEYLAPTRVYHDLQHICTGLGFINDIEGGSYHRLIVNTFATPLVEFGS
jgi:predicted metal-dependent HD superfamily phosphohydrolase